METLLIRGITFKTSSDLAAAMPALAALQRIFDSQKSPDMQMRAYRSVSGNPLRLTWVITGTSVDTCIKVLAEVTRDPEYQRLASETTARLHTDTLFDEWMVQVALPAS